MVYPSLHETKAEAINVAKAMLLGRYPALPLHMIEVINERGTGDDEHKDWAIVYHKLTRFDIKEVSRPSGKLLIDLTD